MEISFFHTCFGKTGNADSISIKTFTFHQSQIKECHPENRPTEQSTSKEPCKQFCSCPWDCPGMWSRDTCLPRPSCHWSPWTAGHEVTSLDSRCFTVQYPYNLHMDISSPLVPLNSFPFLVLSNEKIVENGFFLRGRTKACSILLS